MPCRFSVCVVALALAVVGATGLMSPRVAHAEQAFVSSGENGQAVLLNRLGRCYAITPAHVLGNAGEGKLTGLSATVGLASLLQTFGYDLALMEVYEGPLELRCHDTYRQHIDVEDALRKSGAVTIQSLNEDGSVIRRRAIVTSFNLLTISIKLENADDKFFQGLSGSLVIGGDTAVGMLMSVTPDTGVGTALRYDRLTETIAPFFAGQTSERKSELHPPKIPDEQSSTKLRVLNWNAHPVDALSHADNLIGRSAAPWVAEFNRKPVEILFEYYGDTPIHLISLSSEGCTNLGDLPRDFEILGAQQTTGRFTSLKAATMPSKGGAIQVTFAPVRVKRILLRIYNNWSGSSKVTLGKLWIE